MQAYVLLNCYAQAVINACTVRVKQEVLGVHRHNLDSCTVFLLDTDSCLTHYTGDRLCSRYVLFLSLDNDLTDASTVDLSHQFNLVDSLTNLVLLKVIHQLSFNHGDIKLITVHILNVILNVKEVTLTKDSFHDLSVASLNCLLSSRGNDTATLRVPSLVLSSPDTTEDTLVFVPQLKVVAVTPLTPIVAVPSNVAYQVLIGFGRFIELSGFVVIIFSHNYYRSSSVESSKGSSYSTSGLFLLVLIGPPTNQALQVLSAAHLKSNSSQ